MKWTLDDILEEERSDKLTDHFAITALPNDDDTDSAELYDEIDEKDEDKSLSDISDSWSEKFEAGLI